MNECFGMCVCVCMRMCVRVDMPWSLRKQDRQYFRTKSTTAKSESRGPWMLICFGTATREGLGLLKGWYSRRWQYPNSSCLFPMHAISLWVQHCRVKQQRCFWHSMEAQGAYRETARNSVQAKSESLKENLFWLNSNTCYLVRPIFFRFTSLFLWNGCVGRLFSWTICHPNLSIQSDEKWIAYITLFKADILLPCENFYGSTMLSQTQIFFLWAQNAEKSSFSWAGTMSWKKSPWPVFAVDNVQRRKDTLLYRYFILTGKRRLMGQLFPEGSRHQW